MFPKDKDEMKKQSNIIYWYRCGRTECDDEHIGESARTLEGRFKEHLKAPSPIYEHDNTLATKHQWRTLRLLEERVMASPEPSRRPSTLGLTTLLSIEMWTNITCHIFGTKFGLPPQNSNNTPLHLNICALEVKDQLATNIHANMVQ